MMGEDVNMYIATFNRLTKTAGFSTTDLRTIMMFRNGLNPNLYRQIIMLPKTLSTLEEWQEQARNQQLKYMEAQHITGQKFGSQKQALYQQLGITHRLNQAPKIRDPNAMDIDAMNFQNKYSNGRPNFTNDQKEALKKSGGRFRCGIVGHNACNCRKYP